MYAHSFVYAVSDNLPLLDEEFDKGESVPPPADHTAFAPVLLCDELAWDDQLDNGQEMSL